MATPPLPLLRLRGVPVPPPLLPLPPLPLLTPLPPLRPASPSPVLRAAGVRGEALPRPLGDCELSPSGPAVAALGDPPPLALDFGGAAKRLVGLLAEAGFDSDGRRWAPLLRLLTPPLPSVPLLCVPPLRRLLGELPLRALCIAAPACTRRIYMEEK